MNTKEFHRITHNFPIRKKDFLHADNSLTRPVYPHLCIFDLSVSKKLGNALKRFLYVFWNSLKTIAKHRNEWKVLKFLSPQWLPDWFVTSLCICVVRNIFYDSQITKYYSQMNWKSWGLLQQTKIMDKSQLCLVFHIMIIIFSLRPYQVLSNVGVQFKKRGIQWDWIFLTKQLSRQLNWIHLSTVSEHVIEKVNTEIDSISFIWKYLSWTNSLCVYTDPFMSSRYNINFS